MPADFVEFRTWLATIRSKRQNKPLGDELQWRSLSGCARACAGPRAGRLAHDYSSWVPAKGQGTMDRTYTFDDDEIEENVFNLLIREREPLGMGADPGDLPNYRDVRGWLELFLSSKRLRGLAETTLRDYFIRIDDYLVFVAKNGLSSRALATATIELYLMQRRATVSPFTEHGDFAVLRNFCSWLVKRQYLEVSPMLDLERPKKPRKRMRAVTYQQYRDLYLSIKGDDWPAEAGSPDPDDPLLFWSARQ